MIGRHVDVSATAGYANTASVSIDGAEHFDSYTGQARIRFALKRYLAVYSEYVYYTYAMPARSVAVPDLPRTFEQHSVRFGVMLFMEPIGK